MPTANRYCVRVNVLHESRRTRCQRCVTRTRYIAMKRSRKIVSMAMVAVMATASFSSPQTQQPSEEQVARILKRFPEADKDKNGKLSKEEIEAVRQRFQSRQRNRRPSAAVPPGAGSGFPIASRDARGHARFPRFKNVEVELLEWPVRAPRSISGT